MKALGKVEGTFGDGANASESGYGEAIDLTLSNLMFDPGELKQFDAAIGDPMFTLVAVLVKAGSSKSTNGQSGIIYIDEFTSLTPATSKGVSHISYFGIMGGTTAVPLPASALLLGGALIALGATRRRKVA